MLDLDKGIDSKPYNKTGIHFWVHYNIAAWNKSYDDDDDDDDDSYTHFVYLLICVLCFAVVGYVSELKLIDWLITGKHKADKHDFLAVDV